MLTYLPVLVMVWFVVFIGTAVIFVSSLFRPQNPYQEKLSPWECGMDPVGDASTGRFRVHFFLIAILFVLFDVETLFLFPWAVILSDKSISMLAFVEMFIFIIILGVGFIYAWAKGALDWR